MYSVEIHTPISMNEHFSIMTYLQVKSLAAHARFPGDWRVIYTVSRDSDLDLDSPQFRWARHYPVEFQWVEEDLWAQMGYVGTGTQCITTRHVADVVIYMDADMVVNGSLTEITTRMARTEAVFGWPAWFSGDAPFDEIFRSAGIESDVPFRLLLTDGGADTDAPGWPFYLNFGFIGMPCRLANHMAKSFPVDQAFVERNFANYFSGQVALALNIARNAYACEPIDERYNVGSDHPVALAHYERKLGRRMLPSASAIEDPRVLHYCFPTPTLQKKRDMANWEALMAFAQRPGLQGFERDLQGAIRRLGLNTPGDEYGRYLGAVELARARATLARAPGGGSPDLAALGLKVDQNARDLGSLRDRVERLQQALSHERRSREVAVTAMRQSLSWRLTAPLRTIFDWLFH